MWSYKLSFINPTQQWYEDNNIPYSIEIRFSDFLNKEIETKHFIKYAAGIIHCRCDDELDPDYSLCGRSLAVSTMKASSINEFYHWLENYTSESLDYSILKTYERDRGKRLEYFVKNKFINKASEPLSAHFQAIA